MDNIGFNYDIEYDMTLTQDLETIVVDTNEKCDDMITKLSHEKILGVDVEYWTFDASRGAI